MTTMPRDTLKHLLLDMISTSQPVDVAMMARLDGEDWQTVSNMAGQHGLAPILHHHCQTRGADWVVPADVRAHWAIVYKQSAIRSLSIRRAMLKLHDILDAESIAYAMLKGSWLSQNVYPHPALRPMRDVDILVSAGHAIPVFEALQRKGYTRLYENDVMPLEFALEHHKHLPALKCPISNVTIEVHARLMGELPDGELGGTIADTNALLSRCVRTGTDDVAFTYLSPTDTLLHLIVHSAYDHQFNNGPLVMNDIAAVLSKTEIDWDRFWTMAKAGGWTRGCQLLLAMTKTFHEVTNVPSGCMDGFPTTGTVIEAAALLTLLDFEQSVTIKFRKETLGQFWSRRTFRYLWQRAFPSRHRLARFAGVPLQTKRLWVHFPAWATTRVRQVVFKRIAEDTHADVKRAALVDKWIWASGQI